MSVYRIKPLEWRGEAINEYTGLDAETPFGFYRIRKSFPDGEDAIGQIKCTWCFCEYFDEGAIYCESVEEAKQKAQEHWEEQVSPALEAVKGFQGVATGVKDVNDVMIHEGDRVQLDWTRHYFDGNFQSDGGEASGVVRWDENHCGFRLMLDDKWSGTYEVLNWPLLDPESEHEYEIVEHSDTEDRQCPAT